MTSKYPENDMEADDNGEVESEVVEDENRAEAEEELSLDEVLHLGGTRVSFLSCSIMTIIYMYVLYMFSIQIEKCLLEKPQAVL